eukprot:COSAG02_NODE_8860_length_2418_cov_2.103062_2_plen_45_part_00
METQRVAANGAVLNQPGPTRGMSWCSDILESIVLNSCADTSTTE